MNTNFGSKSSSFLNKVSMLTGAVLSLAQASISQTSETSVPEGEKLVRWGQAVATPRSIPIFFSIPSFSGGGEFSNKLEGESSKILIDGPFAKRLYDEGVCLVRLVSSGTQGNAIQFDGTGEVLVQQKEKGLKTIPIKVISFTLQPPSSTTPETFYPYDVVTSGGSSQKLVASLKRTLSSAIKVPLPSKKDEDLPAKMPDAYLPHLLDICRRTRLWSTETSTFPEEVRDQKDIKAFGEISENIRKRVEYLNGIKEEAVPDILKKEFKGLVAKANEIQVLDTKNLNRVAVKAWRDVNLTGTSYSSSVPSSAASDLVQEVNKYFVEPTDVFERSLNNYNLHSEKVKKVSEYEMPDVVSSELSEKYDSQLIELKNLQTSSSEQFDKAYEKLMKTREEIEKDRSKEIAAPLSTTTDDKRAAPKLTLREKVLVGLASTAALLGAIVLRQRNRRLAAMRRASRRGSGTP